MLTKKQQGFTLLEVVVAMTIFSICVAMGLGIMNYALTQKITNTTVLSIQDTFITASAKMVEEIKAAAWPGQAAEAYRADPNAFIVEPTDGVISNELIFLTYEEDNVAADGTVTPGEEYRIKYYPETNANGTRILKDKAFVTSHTTDPSTGDVLSYSPVETKQQVTPYIKNAVVNFVNNNGKITIIMVAKLGVPGKENYISNIDTAYVRNWGLAPTMTDLVVLPPDPTPLRGEWFTNTGYNFTASFSGGQEPFTYLWSNGGTGITSNYNWITPGKHTPMVTVTDALGQTLTEQYRAASGGEVEIIGQGSTLTVIINPLDAGEVERSSSTEAYPDGTYPTGTVVTLKEIPALSSTFSGWSGAGTSGAEITTTVTIDVDKTVTANFKRNDCTLTYIAGENGTIAPPDKMLQTVKYGASGTPVTAVPSTGYYFVAWNDGKTTATRTETNVKAAVTVTATFAINTYIIAAPKAGDVSNGTVTPVDVTTKNFGESQTYTITPAMGYHIATLTVDGKAVVPIVATYTFANIKTNHTINATFAIDTFTLTYIAGENGIITGTKLQKNVSYGGDGTAVTAEPDMGYHFIAWSDGVETAARTETNVKADASVTATFTANVSGAITIAAGTNGEVIPVVTTLTYKGSAVVITATPAAGYHFVSWAGTDNPSYIKIANSGAASTTIAATSSLPQGGTATVTATFAANVSGTITIATGGNGTVTPTATTLTYAGSPVAITATPAAGYHFVSWAGTDNPSYISIVNADEAVTTIAATSNMRQSGTATVTASFAIDIYTITASAGSNGTVTPSGINRENYGATQAYVIEPATGYHIAAVIVDGMVMATISPYTFTALAADHTIVATFAINIYVITANTSSNGTVTPVGGMTKNYGESQIYIITPDIGYKIASLTVDGRAVTIATTYTFENIAKDYTIRATFAIDTFTLTYIAGPGGTITGTTPQTVNYGTNGTVVTAVPNTNYHFVKWSDAFATTTRTDTNVITDMLATATFAINAYTLIYTPDMNGTITGTTLQTVNYGISGTAVTAVPNTGYYFVNWSDGGGTATRTDTNVIANKAVTANFSTYWMHNAEGISDYTGPGGAETIPGVMDGVTITSIYAQACYSSNGFLLTGVNIPNSVTSIGEGAFWGCSALTSVSIGSGVMSIGKDVFSNCNGLTSIIVNEGNSSYASSLDGVLFNKAMTLLIQYPEDKDGAYAIPNSVASIGEKAFYGCQKLTSVTIPANVTSIGDSAFYGCSALTSVTLPANVTIIGDNAFAGCKGLTSVNIPNSVTSIGDSAFNTCSGLTSVTIPVSVTSIGNRTFTGCTGLTSVNIPNSVTSIGAYAFSVCSALTSVTIPASVTSISASAFQGCSQLLDAYFLGNAPTGTTTVFTGCKVGFLIHYLSTTMGWVPPSWWGFPVVTP